MAFNVMQGPLIIGIDFDDTCVVHEYPRIGPSIGAQPVLHRLVSHGHRLVLWTMRSGSLLDDAVLWFARYNIPLWSVNSNPEQVAWTDSPKAHCDLYIDDRALGIPLTAQGYVNWKQVELMLEHAGVIA